MAITNLKHRIANRWLEYLTTGEAAAVMHVTTQTLINWIRRGRLSCFRVEQGPRKIPTGEILKLMRKNQMPIPPWMLKAETQKP